MFHASRFYVFTKPGLFPAAFSNLYHKMSKRSIKKLVCELTFLYVLLFLICLMF